MAQARTNGRDKIIIVNQQMGAGLTYQVGADMGDNLHPSQNGYDKMADWWKTDLLGAREVVLPTCT